MHKLQNAEMLYQAAAAPGASPATRRGRAESPPCGDDLKIVLDAVLQLAQKDALLLDAGGQQLGGLLTLDRRRQKGGQILPGN